ncbi:MAG: hypothetical protein HQL69_11470 [Magnetococcales bacterium]|nr:hypothetical protein [Magnetococcales bacterium]
MKQSLTTNKSASRNKKETTGLVAGGKKSSKPYAINIEPKVKQQLDLELFEHHLLGFGPCG